MGMKTLTLIDFDKVEAVNLASQGYLEEDLGKSKVEATAAQCRKINSTVDVIAINDKFKRSMKLGDITFCCVDSMDARKFIWEHNGVEAKFFSDGRMSAEVMRVLSVSNADSRRHYPTTLFSDDEAYEGSCTAKSTIYTSNIIAGLMIGQFAKWLRELPVDKDLSLNLLSSEMDVEGD